MDLKTFKKAMIKSATYLDLEVSSDEIYHGNYQSAKKPNNVLEYMLKSIPSKIDKNLLYSEGMSYLIGDLGNLKNIYASLIGLAEEGKVKEVLNLLKEEKNNVSLY